MKRILLFIKNYALYLAFLQAVAASVGSLYFSQVLGYQPCPLCWWQRIFMYPLTILFAQALIRKEKVIAYYALPLAVIGAVVAIYHYLLQMGTLADITPVSCSVLAPCAQTQVLYFGFITIPLLSFAAFLIIVILMLALVSKNSKK